MSHRLSTLSLIIAAASMAGPGSTGAQQESVPREFVEALLGGSRFTGQQQAPQIVVGKVPEDFPSTLLPARPFEVLGSVRYSGQNDVSQRTTVIAVVHRDPDSTLASMASVWEASGWKHPPFGEQMGGFVSPPPGPMPTFYCSESGFLSVSTKPRPAGGNYLRLDFTAGQRDSPCNVPQRPQPHVEDIAMPTLLNPAGIPSTRSSGGGSSWYREMSTTLRTDMTPQQLISHYTSQLIAAGWTLKPAATSADIVVQPLEKKDSKGNTLYGILTAMTIPKPHLRGVTIRILLPEGMEN